MKLFSFKKIRIIELVSVLQLYLFLFYLTLNIINVGELGTGLLLLAGFVLLSSGVFFLQSLKMQLVIRLQFLLFSIFILWLAIRVIVDLGDLEHLKQITIATTGGIFLFYLLGIFLRQALDTSVVGANNNLLAKSFLIFFTLAMILIYLSFKARLLDRIDIFYIEGVDGSYQRPGNFITIFFTVISFVFLSISLNLDILNRFKFLFWLVVYTTGFAFALVSSQMIGSNSATANLAAIYLMTVVISVVSLNDKFRNAYIKGRLTLPLSKRGIKSLIKYSIYSLLGFIILLFAAVKFTGFDLNTTRVMGFGAGSNTSVASRFDILTNTGLEQISHSPILGNTNVAFLTTGNSGRTLHNFIPNVIAELGLLGFSIIVLLLFYIFKQLLNETKIKTGTIEGFRYSIISTWLFFVLVFLFVYANFAVGKSWPVLWFYLGFATTPFYFRKAVN